jgi:hypothetical protein
MKPRYWLAFVTILGFTGSTPGEAGTIVSPGSATTAIPTAGGNVGLLIDQSGLSVNFISGVTDFDTYIALGPTSAIVTTLNGWASQVNKLPGFVQFDLGADYAISGFALWNQSTPNLGVNSFTLTSASDAGFTSNVTNLGTFNAVKSLAAQTFTVSGTGEFVRMEINSTLGANQVNLGEVAFDATLIPEPASLAVLGLSCVGMRFARRRRAILTTH